ncbi:AraC family transcriptional regulator [Streptomyces sp. CAI-121]|uniref:AraC family transcriptional regulator n=1 Tax=unclassified Streptomyces TaxID=2593676 RepID=UPI001587B497|nr:MULTISPECIES: AraC family transcriptional regulator [unclassified Streptomyces]NUV68970.1 AraC family transcriptional regulator [Streptomyces sp. CAI-121]NUW15167.1 AraC family transcriptional regulator [Streptomyces sp. CAI-68]
MDVFDELLRGVRGRGAVFGRSVLCAPWSLRFTDGAYLTLCLPLRGAGWIVPEGGEPLRVEVGEAAVVRGPAPFVFTDDPVDATGAGRAGGVREVRWDQVRDSGAASGSVPEFDCATVLLAAAYDVQEQLPQRLLRALPPALVVPDEEDCAPLRDYLEAQLGRGRPGDQIVLDRLLDWMLVCTLRDWFDRPEANPPGWYGALGDEVAGPALRAMHDDPAHPWTTAELAGRAGVSRTTLAKRFTELVGDGPVAYLTEWRMTLAADLLTRPELTVAAVARRVGYADAFGFSAAFKRVRGESPSAFRREALVSGPVEAGAEAPAG